MPTVSHTVEATKTRFIVRSTPGICLAPSRARDASLTWEPEKYEVVTLNVEAEAKEEDMEVERDC